MPLTKKDPAFPPDVVEVSESGVKIVTAWPLEGWRVKAYRRTEVIYASRRYFVAAAGTHEEMFVYFLEPWPDDLHDIPGLSVVYEEGRSSVLAAERAQNAPPYWQQIALLAAWPVLGFLPASVKVWLDDVHGVDPVSVTRQSLFLEYLMTLLGLGLVLIDLFTSILPDVGLWGVLIALGAVGIDALARYNCASLGGRLQPGFWEWFTDALFGKGRF